MTTVTTTTTTTTDKNEEIQNQSQPPINKKRSFEDFDNEVVLEDEDEKVPTNKISKSNDGIDNGLLSTINEMNLKIKQLQETVEIQKQELIEKDGLIKDNLLNKYENTIKYQQNIIDNLEKLNNQLMIQNNHTKELQKQQIQQQQQGINVFQIQRHVKVYTYFDKLQSSGTDIFDINYTRCVRFLMNPQPISLLTPQENELYDKITSKHNQLLQNRFKQPPPPQSEEQQTPQQQQQQQQQQQPLQQQKSPQQPPQQKEIQKEEQKEKQKEQQEQNEDLVTVRVLNQKREEICFKIRKSTKFIKLIEAYNTRQGIAPGSGKFLYNGEIISENDTPELFGIEDNDQIDFILIRSGC